MNNMAKKFGSGEGGVIFEKIDEYDYEKLKREFENEGTSLQ